ncbi:MAG: hypothetical protein LBQ94_08140 [Treponema sp.]|jgi:hypothetical protein|nr:hypothetical protein [Treponema sp.]
MKKLRFFGLLAAAVLLAFALVISCGGGEEPGIVEPPPTQTPDRPIPPGSGGSAYTPPAPTYNPLYLSRTQIAVVKGGTGETITANRPVNKWDSSDPNVAGVIGGVVTGKEVGRATIYATDSAGEVDSCEVIVIDGDPKAVAIALTPGNLTVAKMSWAEIDAYVNKIGITGGLTGANVTSLSDLVKAKFDATSAADVKLLVTNYEKDLKPKGITATSDGVLKVGDPAELKLVLNVVLNGASSKEVVLAQGWTYKDQSNNNVSVTGDGFSPIEKELVYKMPLTGDDVTGKKLAIYPSALITVKAVIAPPTTNTLVAFTTSSDLALGAGDTLLKLSYTSAGDLAKLYDVSFTPTSLAKEQSVLVRANDGNNKFEIATSLADVTTSVNASSFTLKRPDGHVIPTYPGFTLTLDKSGGTYDPGLVGNAVSGLKSLDAGFGSYEYTFTIERKATVIPYIRILGQVTTPVNLGVLATTMASTFVTTPTDAVKMGVPDFYAAPAGTIKLTNAPTVGASYIAEFTLTPVTTDSNLIIVPSFAADSASPTMVSGSTVITTSPGGASVKAGSYDGKTGAYTIRAPYTTQ